MTPPARPLSVLVVEDEDLIREPIVRELSDAGFEVVEARSGEAAMQVLRDSPGRFDGLYTDIRLSGIIDGWRVADEFRFSHPLRPVIYATGYSNEAPRRVKGSVFLRKPYSPSQVVAAFQDLHD